MRQIRRLLLGVVAAAAIILAAESGNSLFEKGLVKERADADLRGAIKIYEQVVRENSRDRKLAAQALVRMGQCYERLGDADARKTYERAVRDFGDQKEAVATARARLAALGASAGGTGLVTTQLQSDMKDPDTGRVSPDGRSYAFIATGDLAVRDLVTSQLRRITKHESGEYARNPEWSGDGRQLMYVWHSQQRDSELRTVQSDGTGVKTVFRREGFLGLDSWSADGTKALVYISPGRDVGEFRVLDVAAGRLEDPKSTWFHGRLSPDGKWIAVEGPAAEKNETDLYIVNANGEDQAVVSVAPGYDQWPEWSADGKHLVFLSERTGPSALWSVRVIEGKPQGEPVVLKSDIGIQVRVVGLSRDGSLFFTRPYTEWDLYEAAFDPSAQKVIGEPKLLVTEGRGRNRNPSISPDGQWLAFKRRAEARDWNKWLVVVRSLKTGKEKVLPVTTGYLVPEPQWSADSKSVAVMRNVVNIETGETKKSEDSPLPDNAQFNALLETRKSLLRISPDGAWWALIAAASSGTGNSLYLVPAKGGDARELVRPAKERPFRPGFLQWSPSSDSLYFGAAANSEEKTQAWTVSLAGGEPQPTGLHLTEGAAFAPDGRRVIFGNLKATVEFSVIRNLPGL